MLGVEDLNHVGVLAALIRGELAAVRVLERDGKLLLDLLLYGLELFVSK